jgi:hypothetical protein
MHAEQNFADQGRRLNSGAFVITMLQSRVLEERAVRHHDAAIKGA